MNEQIDAYTPVLKDTVWLANAEFIRAAAKATRPSGPSSTKTLMSALTAYVRWCAQAGHRIDRSVVFDRWLIEEFIARGCPHTWSDATKGTMRSYLFTTAMAVSGPNARIPRVAPMPAAKGLAPYASDEMKALRSWATSQATEAKRRDAMVLLALGAGAGLAAEDIGRVTVADVVEDDGATLINVTGRRPRSVPVLASWETDLRAVLVGARPEAFALGAGRSVVSKNVVTNLVDRSSGKTKPNSQRLRATWIVHHLTVGTPVKALLSAAGVQSLEAFTRYIEYVPNVEPAVARRFLRGAAK